MNGQLLSQKHSRTNKVEIARASASELQACFVVTAVMSEEEKLGRGAQGGSSSRGGPWASVLLSINDKLGGIAARLDAVERQQKQDLVERQQQEGEGGSSRGR